MTHANLVDIAHRLVLRKFSCGVAFKEQVTLATSEIPDVIGFGAWGHSVLIEVKVSRADFKRNAKKAHKYPMGKYRFFCIPTGMVEIEDLPEGWGLIEVNENGRLHRIYNPYTRHIGANPIQDVTKRQQPHTTSPTIERNFMYSVLRKQQVAPDPKINNL